MTLKNEVGESLKCWLILWRSVLTRLLPNSLAQADWLAERVFVRYVDKLSVIAHDYRAVFRRHEKSERTYVAKSTDSPFVKSDVAHRWGILICLATLNFACTITWVSVGATSAHFDKYYQNKLASSWLSVVYAALLIPAVIGAVAVDAFLGARTAMLVCSLSVLISSLFRLGFDFLPLPPLAKLILQAFGHVCAAVAYPCATVLPIRLVLRWFPRGHRIFACGLTFVANVAGILVASLVGQKLHHHKQVPLFNLATAILNLVVGGWSLLVARKALDNNPKQVLASFIDDVKLLANKRVLGVTLCAGSCLAAFNAVLVVLPKMLCSSGYDMHFANTASVMFLVGGASGILFAGLIVDYTKKHNECFKIGMSLSIIAQLFFFQLVLHPGNGHVLLIGITFTGEFLLGLVPLAIYVAARRAEPACESLPAGMALVLGQLLTIFYLMFLANFSRPLPPHRSRLQVCSRLGAFKAQDMTLSVTAVSILSTVFLVLLFFLDRKQKHDSSTTTDDTPDDGTLPQFDDAKAVET